MTSVLDRVTEEHVHSDPYSHLRTYEALEPSYYESLAAHFPDFSDIIRRGGDDSARQQLGENNVLMHLSGLHAFNDDFPIDPEWQEFMALHFSNDFVHQVIRYLGDGIRQSYQDLEQRLGKSLDELTVQPRHTKDQGADLWIDVQFAVNTPVRKSSRVRGRHVDDPKKLFAGLFYMRAPEDDSIGGDLEICRWQETPQFKNDFVLGHQVQNTHIQDHQVDLVDVVKYRANTLLLFINTPYAVHGVTERQPTHHFRRYINMIAEFREPLYDFKKYQGNATQGSGN